ncbi:MAG: type II toxin-antitoxin system VapC family toxin [Hyphomonas sp.]
MTALRAVFDNSAIIPVLVPHPLTDLAVGMLERFEPVLLSFLKVECANVLRKMVRAGTLSPAGASQALASLSSEFLFEPFEFYLPGALDRAIVADHGVYDCLYVEAARQTNAPLITADKRLTRKFAHQGALMIINLFDLPETLP